MNNPITIVVTEGDPAGIGPEVVTGALEQWQRPNDCRIVVVGYPEHFAPLISGVEFTSEAELHSSPGFIGAAYVQPDQDGQLASINLGKPTPSSAGSALASLELGTALCLQGFGDALCTAPIHKAMMPGERFPYPGQTEFLAARSSAKSYAMMLVGGGLRVVLATIHEPLARVASLILRENITRIISLTSDSLKDFGVDRPRIAVAGLNPHSGEGGKFGREEIEIIGPAVKDCLDRGIDVSGPFSPDTVFHQMLEGRYDVVVAMYHDQGLIPVKTLDFFGAVNVTLGLPFVRTSPDHGTAFDLAGKNMANPSSMLTALQMAYDLALARKRLDPVKIEQT